jgi:hypothetical protein
MVSILKSDVICLKIEDILALSQVFEITLNERHDK